MLRNGQESDVRAERDVLRAASLAQSPNSVEWLVRLYYSFQDFDHLYLVGILVISFRALDSFLRFWNT